LFNFSHNTQHVSWEIYNVGILKKKTHIGAGVPFSKMPYKFLCFATHSLNRIEKSKVLGEWHP
jgi:hypothetical protein